MIKHYVLKSQTNRARMVFRYNINGVLVGYDLLGEYNKRQEVFLLEKIENVFTEVELKAFCAANKLTLKVLQGDLTFESFWNTYNHKVGKRMRCMKIWEELPEGERALAIAYIDRYKHTLKLLNQDNPMYPETYLHNQTWHNED